MKLTDLVIVPIQNVNGLYKLKRDCVESECQITTEAVVTGGELFLWQAHGEKVQRAFPNLTAGEREALFLSGMCSSCYDTLMGGM